MTHLWTRTAIIIAAAGVLGACTTANYPVVEGQAPREPMIATKPNYPIVQPQASAAQSAPAQAAPAAAPSAGAVSSQSLPPAATPAPTAAAVASQPLTPAISATPPAPVTRTVSVAAGKVVDGLGKPTTYVVEPGDTLYAISRKLGTTVDKLADDNNLSPPYSLRPGQTLKGPAPKTKAYVVEPGDTLFAIGRRFSVTPQQLADANGVAVSTPIEIGQKLALPNGYRDTGPATKTITVAAQTTLPSAPIPYARPTTTAAAPTSATTAVVASQTAPPPPPPPPPPPLPTTGPRPYTPSPGVVAPPKPATTPATPSVVTTLSPEDAAVAAAGKDRFAWPVQGEVISSFGPKSGGQRNDGLNISAVDGTVVRAAAGGEVVYAGDQVPGFGNLVLIKHEDGWVTAYAHMSRIDVKMRDFVGQGQQLGLVGSTGGVDGPQLHFEVRYAPSPTDKARPIDPALVLP
ncbi:MAG TPA: LysM peptidoglycan-binding domain-containing M23 family metallopeptidase [Caulobacteraceae bacterium]